MVQELVKHRDTGWLSAATEAEAYEGIREGEEAAFRAAALPLQPVLRRLARVIVRSPDEADDITVRTWVVALHGLDMFTWHTPFATWVARITVAQGRTRARETGPHAHSAVPVPPRPAPGPDDWSDLPWSARWEHALPILATSYWALPLAQREVVHARDVERWTSRRVCDVL